PQYKRHGRVVRAVIEDLYPALAEERMLNGAPCQTVKLNNLPKFFPLISDLARRGVRKVSQKTLGRTILVDRTLAYSPLPWYLAILSDGRLANALTYESMVTRNIYERARFNEFIEKAKTDKFRYYQQLGNILTLELRMRDDKIAEGDLG
ncbi:MAG: hypothetical protein ACRD2X_25260, partial [Vicinamibacteraceae bacterium]